MDGPIAFFVVVAATLWIVVAAIGRWRRRARRRRHYTELARRFGGQFRAGGLFRHSAAQFRYGQTWVTVCEINDRGPFEGRTLQARIHWPHSNVRCELLSQTARQHGRPRQSKWREVQTDPELAGLFEVWGEDAGELRQMLTSGVRWQLDRLAHLGPVPQLHVLIRWGEIVVEKPCPVFRAEEAAQFVQGTLELYDQCMLAKATGIQFLHTDEAQPLVDVICKVCGEEIQDAMVVCRRCKTPHHLDCWQYTGTCSVFGCRETEYRVPPAGHSLPPS